MKTPIFPISDLGWRRKAPEITQGDYWFDGTFYATSLVEAELSKTELLSIYQDIRQVVKLKGGQDYLQVYRHKKKGLKLFLIDQVTRSSLESGEHPKEHHYCTLRVLETLMVTYIC